MNKNAYSQSDILCFKANLTKTKSAYTITYGRNIGLKMLDTLYGVANPNLPAQFVIVGLSDKQAQLLPHDERYYTDDSLWIKMKISVNQENIFTDLFKEGVIVQSGRYVLNSPEKIYSYDDSTVLRFYALIGKQLNSVANKLTTDEKLSKGKYRHCSLKYALEHTDNQQIEHFFHYLFYTNKKSKKVIKITENYMNWLYTGTPYSPKDLLKKLILFNTENELKNSLKRNNYQYDNQHIIYMLTEAIKDNKMNPERAYKSAKIAEILSENINNDSLRLESKLSESKSMLQKKNFVASGIILEQVLNQSDSLHYNIIWINAFLTLLKQKIYDANFSNIAIFKKIYLPLLKAKKTNVQIQIYNKTIILFYEALGDYYFLRKDYILAKKNYRFAMEMAQKGIYNKEESEILQEKMTLCKNN